MNLVIEMLKFSGKQHFSSHSANVSRLLKLHIRRCTLVHLRIKDSHLFPMKKLLLIVIAVIIFVGSTTAEIDNFIPGLSYREDAPHNNLVRRQCLGCSYEYPACCPQGWCCNAVDQVCNSQSSDINSGCLPKTSGSISVRNNLNILLLIIEIVIPCIVSW